MNFGQDPNLKIWLMALDFYKWSTDQMLLNWFVKRTNESKKHGLALESLYTAVKNINKKKVTLLFAG